MNGKQKGVIQKGFPWNKLHSIFVGALYRFILCSTILHLLILITCDKSLRTESEHPYQSSSSFLMRSMMFMYAMVAGLSGYSSMKLDP